LRSHKQNILIVAVIFAAVGAASPVCGLDIISVEEHWELKVGGPDMDRSAPQVNMVMSPLSDLAGTYFVFSLNHATLPGFAAGGMQVQQWGGDDIACWNDAVQEGTTLCYHEETVQWTQRISLDEGQLVFEISDGVSQTWNSFGNQSQLRSSVSTSLASLSGYRPAVSLNESGINYAGNRVSSLILKKITWTTSDGEEHEMVAPIDIDADLLDP